MNKDACAAERRQTLLSWSGGKDAALSLLRLQEHADVVGLWTVVTSTRQEATSHGTPLWAIEEQARALDLPLVVTQVPPGAPNNVWVERCRKSLNEAIPVLGADALAFGDVHLEEVRRFREQHLNPVDLLFPLWGEPPARLAREALDRGIRARIISTREDLALTGHGSAWDHGWISRHPDLDPLGENGEFHTFVEAMPGFAHAVRAQLCGSSRTEHGYVRAEWTPRDGDAKGGHLPEGCPA